MKLFLRILVFSIVTTELTTYKNGHQMRKKGYERAINFGKNFLDGKSNSLEYKSNNGATSISETGRSNKSIVNQYVSTDLQLQQNEDLEYFQHQDPNWWRKSVFYQIYPRSFKDSDGDGVGDLQGIMQTLSHLKDAGVDAAWISPIFKSPMVDFGYDISDHCDVDPIFGSLNDLILVIKKAHELGIKIILDFVPNHTSTRHEWFIKSENREVGYEDYYIWHDGKMVEGQATPDFPNNWLSVFSGPAWTWSPKRNQYYLNQFSPAQADLNYRNEKVQQEMTNTVMFLIKLGIDGLRIDAPNYIFEDELFRDEPIAYPIITSDPTNHDYLDHIYTKDMDGGYDIVAKWRRITDDYTLENPEEGQKVIMTEAWTNFNGLMRWYGTEEVPISHIPINFDFLSDINAYSTATHVGNIIDKWLNKKPLWASANWVLGTHDKNRIGSRFGQNRIDSLNMLLLTLPGISTTYYGDEIGMIDNSVITWEQTQDPQLCQTRDPKKIQLLSRDPARTPFQWDKTKHAGFSKAATTWVPVHSNYLELNLANQKHSANSHFKLYQQLTKLRQEEEFLNGDYSSITTNNVLVFKRSIVKGKGYIVAISFENSFTDVKLESLGLNASYIATVISVTGNSNKIVWSQFVPNELRLQPYEGIIFRYIQNLVLR